MKITSEIPRDWRNLQDLVCKYLNEAGYEAETTKTIELVRGEVEVDVYAKAKNELIKMFICECKFWDSPVPKEKVHAFRSVVADSGAAVGILISKSGFQKGAVDAAYCSNVLLKDWNSFIDMIGNQWVYHRMLEIKRLLQPLSAYTDPIDDIVVSLKGEAQAKYFELIKKYIHDYMFGVELNMKVLREDSVTIDNISFVHVNELFEYLERVYTQAEDDFSSLLPEVDRDKFGTGGYTLFSMLDEYYEGRY